MIKFKYIKTFIICILFISEFYLIALILKEKFITFKIYINKMIFRNNILIEIDISEIKNIRGPGSYIRGINQVLPFFWENCIFVSSNFVNNICKPDLYFFPFPKFNISQYINFSNHGIINKFILGPIFVPKYWKTFPNYKLWVERNFPILFNLTKGIAVHSLRVRDFLAKRSNITNLKNKFIIMRPCTNIKPIKIKSFQKRKIDIIFFEKYSDYNRRKEGEEMLNLLKNTSKKITSLKYGSFKIDTIEEIANDSKFIIYFSFYDTGAIALKEFQNYGVITFTHQQEFVIDKETSFYIPELDNTNNMLLAFNKIMNIIENISNSNVKSELIAKKNQMINKCQNSLIDLCKSLH